MKRALVALAFGAFGVTAGCNPFAPGGGLSPMTVEPQGGSIDVVRDGERIEVTGRFGVEPGDEIDTGGIGARLHLEGDRFAYLGTETTITLTDGSTLENDAGAVLMDTSDASTVVFDEVEASTTGGILRVERDRASASAAVIEGGAQVTAPGQEPEELGRLFEVSVVAGDVLDPRPYRIDDGDAWDRRYLADVVELELQLQRYADALRAQTAGQRPRSAYFSDLAEGEDVGFMRSYLESETPTTDLIIGFTIASVDRQPSLRASFRHAFLLREDGGQWGVVSTLLGVESRPLLADLERLGSDILAAGQGRATGVTFGPPSGGDGGSSGEAGTRAGDDGPSSGGPGSGSEDGDQGGNDESPADDCDNVVDCTLQVPLPSPNATETGLP
jgi:hypothetical protein